MNNVQAPDCFVCVKLKDDYYVNLATLVEETHRNIVASNGMRTLIALNHIYS